MAELANSASEGRGEAGVKGEVEEGNQYRKQKKLLVVAHEP